MILRVKPKGEKEVIDHDTADHLPFQDKNNKEGG